MSINFDASFYLRENPDVLAAVARGETTAEAHFDTFGWQESRAPNEFFDVNFYLLENPDVLAAGVNPLDHFLAFGAQEGRAPSSAFPAADTFDTAAYAEANPDLADAGIVTDAQLYEHFVTFGFDESRPGVQTVDGTPIVVGSDAAGDLNLTVFDDTLTGSAADNVFAAPLAQDQGGFGTPATTLGNNDVLDGAGGRDELRAVLDANGTTISPTTTNIEEVYLRGQFNTAQPAITPGAVPIFNTIDAENMSGVEQWWTEDSRSNISIEDIRSAPADTTFGMRNTDPAVGYQAYFNANFVEGIIDTQSDLTLVVQEITDGQDPSVTELENITVREVNFTLNETDFTIATDDLSAANTWDELEAAIAADLAAQGLDTVSVSHNGGGNFVISDSDGGTFEVEEGEALIFGAAPDIDVRNRIEVGRIFEEGPTNVDVVLDGAGNGSQGGSLNLGAMSGLRGIETFDVSVGDDSHLTGMGSMNQRGSGTSLPNEFLETVNLSSIGAEGDLTIGARTTSPDGRVASTGLVNVREVNGGDFAGELNLGISLGENTITRYLDDATGTVDFTYTAGNLNDLFNIQLNPAVAADQDFAMSADMDAGDDRLIISAPTARAVSVDGGEGVNSIVVSQSHGTEEANTFETFANFQTYEVEGNGVGSVDNTEHDFASMSGIENVVVATDGNTPGLDDLPTAGDNTQLINLEAAQNVTVSGRNQTVGNNSTANQIFGDIQLTDDTGETRVLTLENTARLANDFDADGEIDDGRLIVGQITIDEDEGTSATRTLDVVSGGARNTANIVNVVDAEQLTTLNMTGTQDLSLHVATMATEPVSDGDTPALTVSGEALEGDLTLALNSAILDRDNLDVVTGTAGETDTLQLYGTDPGAATVSGFETIQFGAPFAAPVLDFSGTFDAANTSGVSLYDFVDLGAATIVSNLGGAVTAEVGVEADQDLTFSATTAGNGNTLDITFDDDTGGDFYTSTLTTENVRSIDVTLEGEDGDNDGFAFNLATDAFARTVTFTGGNEDDDDTLTLGAPLENSLSTIDFSEFEGEIGAITLDAAAVPADQSNTVIRLNGRDAAITDNVATTVTTFRLTEDAVSDTDDLTITGFRTLAGGTAPTVNDVSVLDLRDLGVEGISDLSVTAAGPDTVITSTQGLDFEITLAGVATTDLDNSFNFLFSA